MTYPTMAEVDAATHEQLARWSRFLPLAGESAIHGDPQKFHEVLAVEGRVIDRIETRLKALGGITPEISKRIGWER